MPIYDQGYQRWEGELKRHPFRWWPILRRGALQVLKQRKFIILLILAWMPPLVQGVRLFINSRAGRLAAETQLRQFFDTGPGFFFSVLENQGVFVLLFVLFVGSTLISRDRQFNALQTYFSKPLTANDYILGKLAIVGSFILTITLVPVMLLWLFAISLGTSFSEIWFVPLASFVYSLLVVAVAGSLVLALSASARRTIFIMVSWIVLYGYGLGWIAFILREITGSDYWGLLLLDQDVEQVGAWIFGRRLPMDLSPVLSLLILAGAVVLCQWQLRRRIKPVEVVL